MCRLVVELKRDMIVRGTLESVDAGMGLTLTDVVFENIVVGACRWSTSPRRSHVGMHI
jgi:small nuclear ribonucleoprotein (snRNP)-like protein